MTQPDPAAYPPVLASVTEQFGPVLSKDTLDDQVADGRVVPLSEETRAALDVLIPAYFTATLHRDAVAWPTPDEALETDLPGCPVSRERAILFALRLACQVNGLRTGSSGVSSVQPTVFRVAVLKRGAGAPQTEVLGAVVSASDDGQPALLIGYLDELD
jgi:hypothetical protein